MYKDKHEYSILLGLGIIPVLYIAILFAPHIQNGLIYSLPELTEALNHPFDISWSSNTPKTLFIFSLFYLVGVFYYLSTKKNYRRNEEYGSAKWADGLAINKKYACDDYDQNKIFTQHVKMGLDGKIHRRNLNTLVIGGSGAGKTRFYAKPNIMQCNTSMVILDPKAELLRDTGNLLEKEGYVIKVLDLLDMVNHLEHMVIILLIINKQVVNS